MFFSRAFHTHDSVYVVRGEKVRAAKRLSGASPSQISPLKHVHSELVAKNTTRYVRKDAVAKVAKSVKGTRIWFVSASSSPAMASATVRIDLLEAVDAKDFPNYAYAVPLTRSVQLEFYLDAVNALRHDTRNANVVRFSVQTPALTFLEELARHIPFLPRLSENLFTVTVRSRHFTHIVARQVVRVEGMAKEVHLTIGGEAAWDNFQNYTTTFQNLLNQKVMEHYGATGRTPDLWKHFSVGVFGIAGNQVVVENCGFPYTVVVYAGRGEGPDESAFSSLLD